ncbi:nuclease Le1 [Macrolepiota fuliginosa MF-IS2]|uniref:Nuclease Le1 n=1 Tax=Macrolepiota fuliginosa MF-IS2 TaxID=1400762 RepID=A0A9P5XQM6_9AGAR|nr:nuclease Le1 [Macrolepiota fuliginosa MF-IS2]
MKIITSLFCVISLAAISAYGWGANGHEAVGYVAMQFLAPNALSFVQSSLGSTYSESLGPAATWADDVKSSKAYSWSAILHFVDANDDPPTSCSVSQSRDCADNQCILGAIANYTTRVVDTSLSADQRQEALKFIDHFIGDIGQPLHVEAVAAGGNGISIKCNGATSNLHSVWDSGLINKLLSSNYDNSVTTWANTLATRIKSGAYQSLAAPWISCSSTTATASIQTDISNLLSKRAITPLQCPLVWAEDSNSFDCSYVFSYTSFTDLCTSDYYTNAVPIIETQIAKQGYRLAAWLNVLFDGAINLP